MNLTLGRLAAICCGWLLWELATGKEGYLQEHPNSNGMKKFLEGLGVASSSLNGFTKEELVSFLTNLHGYRAKLHRYGLMAGFMKENPEIEGEREARIALAWATYHAEHIMTRSTETQDGETRLAMRMIRFKEESELDPEEVEQVFLFLCASFSSGRHELSGKIPPRVAVI